MTRVIFHRTGEITVQLPEWAHCHTDPEKAASDIIVWFQEGNTEGWDCDDCRNESESALLNPSSEQIQNGEYRIWELPALDDHMIGPHPEDFPKWKNDSFGSVCEFFEAATL